MTIVRRALPWALGTLAIVMDAIGAILMVKNAALAPGLFVPQVFMVPGYAAVGAVVASRRRTHPAGWLFLGVGLMAAVTALSFSFASAVLVTKLVSLPGAVVAAWVSNWSFPLGFLFFGLVLLLFPTGSLPSRRWRALPVVLIVAWGAFVVVSAFGPSPIELGSSTKVPNPFEIGVVRGLGGLLYPFLIFPAIIGLVLCGAAPFFRRRKADPVEREQLRWLASVCGFAVVAAVGTAIPAQLKNDTFVAIMGFVVLIVLAVGIPVAVGVAILRYRLFDIDRIISRTVSYGLVTAFLGGLYALIAVVLPSSILGTRATPNWVIAAGTLVAAAAFVPVRRRVQNAVDHRFNRQRYDAERTIETFTAQLRSEIDIDALGAELKTVVNDTVEPTHVAIWLRTVR